MYQKTLHVEKNWPLKMDNVPTRRQSSFKVSYLTYQSWDHEDLWPLSETSKGKLYKFAQISVKSFHPLNLNFHNLRFRLCVNVDNWLEVCADFKELPMHSCLLILTILSFENSKFLHLTFFGDTNTQYTAYIVAYSEHCHVNPVFSGYSIWMPNT